jgi:hypothetical protein
MRLGLRVKYSFLLSDFIGTEFSRQIFKKYSYMKRYENPSNGSRFVPCGNVDRHVTKQSHFCQFANAPKKASNFLNISATLSISGRTLCSV